jgi:hypothetical protein
VDEEKSIRSCYQSFGCPVGRAHSVSGIHPGLDVSKIGRVPDHRRWIYSLTPKQWTDDTSFICTTVANQKLPLPPSITFNLFIMGPYHNCAYKKCMMRQNVDDSIEAHRNRSSIQYHSACSIYFFRRQQKRMPWGDYNAGAGDAHGLPQFVRWADGWWRPGSHAHWWGCADARMPERWAGVFERSATDGYKIITGVARRTRTR